MLLHTISVLELFVPKFTVGKGIIKKLPAKHGIVDRRFRIRIWLYLEHSLVLRKYMDLEAVKTSFYCPDSATPSSIQYTQASYYSSIRWIVVVPPVS